MCKIMWFASYQQKLLYIYIYMSPVCIISSYSRVFYYVLFSNYIVLFIIFNNIKNINV
jgi:hypothetical protein